MSHLRMCRSFRWVQFSLENNPKKILLIEASGSGVLRGNTSACPLPLPPRLDAGRYSKSKDFIEIEFNSFTCRISSYTSHWCLQNLAAFLPGS